LHWFENPPTDSSGSSSQFGPYRVFPPGAKIQDRTYPDDPDPIPYSDSRDRITISKSDLYIPPPPGYTESGITAKTRRGEPHIIAAEWVAGDSHFNVVSVLAPAWRLPLDVYLDLPESRFVQRTLQINGHPAIVDEPKAGPMPNVGYVRVWMGGWEIVITSPNVGQDRLLSLADQLTVNRPVANPSGGTR